MNDLYETDAVVWAREQAALLRRMAAGERVNDQIDWNNVAEEIEDVAHRYEERIEGALVTLIVHLLKWRYQPAMRSNAWRGIIVAERNRIAKLTRRQPSMARYPATVLAEVYPDARTQAEAETGLTGFTEICPWAIEQVLDHAFWPEAPVA
jgi:hypothetical protein